MVESVFKFPSSSLRPFVWSLATMTQQYRRGLGTTVSNTQTDSWKVEPLGLSRAAWPELRALVVKPGQVISALRNFSFAVGMPVGKVVCGFGNGEPPG